MKNRLYKNKYFIVFYDRDDRYLLHMFDNIKEILLFLKLEFTNNNIVRVSVELYRALKSPTRITRMLGTTMRVYIIDENKETDYMLQCN